MSLPGPDARVVELRVPGLVGVSGEQLLDSVEAVTVAGDETGQFVRPADRLRRPAPGPVLQALGRAMPRTLEGYLWRKLTSGGVAKAAWALLFPFSLANVAHGMLPPTPRRGVTAALIRICQAVLRLIGVLLTALLVTQLGVISMDILAGQCLAPGADCLPGVPHGLRTFDPVRTVIGLAPPLVIVALLHRASTVSWRRAEVFVAQEVPTAARPLPGDPLEPSPHGVALRGLHTVTALCITAFLGLGGPFAVPEGAAATTVWALTVAVVLFALLAAVLLDDDARWPGGLSRPAQVWTLIAAGVALVLAAGITGPGPTAGYPGIDAMVEGNLAALLVACAVFAVLLALAALLARSAWRDLPRRLRPWLGGWVAVPTTLLACLIGAGFGAGLAISTRELLGGRTTLPASYEFLTILWGVGTPVAVALWMVMYFVAIPLRKRSRGIPMIVRMLQRGADSRRKAADAWAKAIIERKHLHRLVAAVVLLLTVGAGGLIVLRINGRTPPAWLDAVSSLGVLALGLIAAGLVRMVYTAVRWPERGRHLAALADLVYIWPRRAHPIVPPSYALKVVPDLVARASKHLREPNTRVVLAGYSHGGLLAMIAAARLSTTLTTEQSERLGLVTAGTPAQWGYQRAFPALLSPGVLAPLYGALEGRWRGLCRGTDPFGGGVTTWRHQVYDNQLLGIGYRPDGSIGPLPPAVAGAGGALVLGGDHWLPDPVAHHENGRRWSPGVLRHNDYLVDPEWDRAVAMAAGLEQPGAAIRVNGSTGTYGANGEQSSLLGDLPKLP